MFRSTGSDNYPPLHNIFLWPVIQLFGDSEFVLRAPSAVFATLNVAAVFLLGRELAGVRAGLIAAMLLTVMPVEIEQAHNARMYTLLSLTTTLYLWCTLRYLRMPSRAGAIIASIAALAMLLSHLFGTFVFIGISLAWAWMFFIAKRIRPADYWALFGWHTAAFMVFLPWFVILIGRAIRITGEGFWLPYPDGEQLLLMVSDLFATPVLVFAILVLAAGALSRIRAGGGPRVETGKSVFVAAALLGPALIGYIASVLFEPILHSRYMIFAVPIGLALTAAVHVRLPLPRMLQWIAVVAVLATMPWLAIGAATEPGPHNDWRKLVATWQDLREPGDSLIIYPSYGIRPFSYYDRQVEVVATPKTFEEMLEPVDTNGRVWIAIRSSDPEIGAAIMNAYRAADYDRENALAFGGLQLLALSRRDQN